MNSISRRRFLKISGATVSLAAASGYALKAAEYKFGSAGAATGIQRIPTYCDVCFWKCGAIASVRDGALWKIEGNPEDPLSRGRLCPRGTGGIGAHSDPDRLKRPLIRTHERGREEWKEVSWDEAFAYIASRMHTIKETYGPESVAMFAHGI